MASWYGDVKESAHLRLAEQFEEDALKSLRCRAYRSSAISAFYSALHYVNAKLARCGEHPETHPHKNRRVSFRITAIADRYLTLYGWSRAIRYRLVAPLTKEDILEHLNLLKDVKKHALRQLKRAVRQGIISYQSASTSSAGLSLTQ